MKIEMIEGEPVVTMTETDAGDTECRTMNYSDPVSGIILFAACSGVCVESNSDCDWGYPADRSDDPDFEEPLDGTEKQNDCICQNDVDPLGL